MSEQVQTVARPRGVWLLLLSATIVAVAATIAYVALGRPPFVGIDDSNITLVYGRNLAAGHGYVYTPGFERVEGSTSFLWTLMVAGACLWSTHPEPWILALAVAMTVGCVWFSLDTLALSVRGAVRSRILALYAVFLSSMFAFFGWTVFTLMDVTLWALLLLWWVNLLTRRQLGAIPHRRFVVWSVLLMVAMLLTRPEAMVIAPAFLVVAGFSEWRRAASIFELWWAYGPALAAAVVASALAAAGRVAYFGMPFPNTYYAKVSGDPIDNLRSGLHYVFGFAASEPFADVLILGTLVAFLWFGGRLCFGGRLWFGGGSRTPIARHEPVAFIVSAGVILIFGLQVVTGGDHFGSFRFFQPIYPLLAIPSVLLLLPLIERIAAFPRVQRRIVWSLVFISAGLAATFKAGHFYRDNGIDHEFTIAAEGRKLGTALNELHTRQHDIRVGVYTAGGVAITFKGRVLDLLGLNWIQMAHASRRRTGLRNHGAFHDSVFWSAKPEIVAPRWSAAAPTVIQAKYANTLLKGLLKQPRFRAEYGPFCYAAKNGWVLAFARNDWRANVKGPGDVRTLSWDDVQL